MTEIEVQMVLQGLIPNAMQLMDEFRHKRRIFNGPTLQTTDSSCVLSGISYPRTPVLVDAYGDVIVEPTHWLRQLGFSRSEKTVHQYATSLSLFWKFLGSTHRRWTKVDDDLLRTWKNLMHRGTEMHKGIKQKSANNNLQVVLSFLKWAQEYGYVKNLIGVTKEGEAPYPIRLVVKFSRKGRRETWPDLYRITRTPVAPIPTSEQIDQMYVHLTGSTPSKHRDYLMASWSSGSGLRRGELERLTIAMLPSAKDCHEMKASNKVHWMLIRGKANKERRVPVDPEVLLETRDFCFGSRESPSSREQMVQKRKRPFKEDSIFLNSRTGEAIVGQSISHIFRHAFVLATGHADRMGLRLHRLRARFATKLVEELAIAALDRGQNVGDLFVQRNILEDAAEILGHSDIKTLRPYINAFLDKDTSPVGRAMSNSRRGQ